MVITSDRLGEVALGRVAWLQGLAHGFWLRSDGWVVSDGFLAKFPH